MGLDVDLDNVAEMMDDVNSLERVIARVMDDDVVVVAIKFPSFHVEIRALNKVKRDVEVDEVMMEWSVVQMDYLFDEVDVAMDELVVVLEYALFVAYS